MNKISRKEFLKLSTAAAATAAISNPAFAQEKAREHTRWDSNRPAIIRGADILTMDAELGEQFATDLLIVDGKIAEIGQNLNHEGAQVIEAQGMILMPGFCCGHRHMWHTIDIGRKVKTEPSSFDGGGYFRWDRRTQVSLTEEDHYLAGYLGGLMAIDSGVTSIVDYADGQHTRGKALAAAKGLKASGVGGWFTLQLGMDATYKPGDVLTLEEADEERTVTSNKHWQTAEVVMSQVFADSKSNLQFGLAPATETEDSLEDIKKEWDRIRGMGVKMIASHLQIPEEAVPAGHMGHRGSGIADLNDVGLLGPDFHVSHANNLTADELQLMKDHGCKICATPMEEFSYPMTSIYRGPIHARADAAGVDVGIGVDIVVAVTKDYFEHMRTAWWSLYIEQDSADIAETYSSLDTLRFGTSTGAKAMQRGDVVGSITVGKQADLVLLSTDRVGFPMAGTLADRVLNFVTQSDVDSVWIAGELRKRNGIMLGVDMKNLEQQRREAQIKVGEKASQITIL